MSTEFDRSVFVNCPFDDEYVPLLRPLLFTILFAGFQPRIASERSDSLELRLPKVCELIRRSRYSIHDLSRLRAGQAGEFYRLNMPFELGVEYGCRSFGGRHLKEKRCLVLEKDAHEFRKALSDLSGVDIKPHDNEPRGVVRAVRNWFRETVGVRIKEGPAQVWYLFNDFAYDFYERRMAEGFSEDDLNMMPVTEYVDFISTWLRAGGKPTPRA